MRVFLILISLALLSACQFFQADAPTPPPTIVPPTLTAPSPPTLPPLPSPTPASANDTLEIQPTPVPETTEPLASETPPQPPAPPLDSLAIRIIPIADGFTRPTFLTNAGDGRGRLFVVEQAGRILIIEDGQVKPTPFLDIVSIVGSDANEQGLLSVAFHPNYASNGLFFVNYTNKTGDTTLARYRVSANLDVADPGSAEILLTIAQPYGNHNGGQLAFGPAGYLYVGMGDGGAANDPHDNGQNLNTLLGKILRLDVDHAAPYGVPADNPFVDRDEARPEIWSLGWRNPWRFSFDRATGDMYIADVGQNNYEEVNVEVAGTPGGQNYGWRLMEGLHCFKPAACNPASLEVVLPLVEYDHGQGCSVTGGYVYRGSQFPALSGIYFYGDYCSGIIWGLRQEADGNWAQAPLFPPGSFNISSFGQDEAGELYVVNHQGDIGQIGR
ncbi:MAG: PQQ-dependent sugar dehydrogenase [Anaerolineae bacterium]|nr:PQQ-dependent sugar dehydrogenase [Anaerolineae bacterium]